MKKMAKRDLKWHATHDALDITKVSTRHCATIEPMDKIAYSVGVYGISGLLLQGRETGNFYVIKDRTPALFYFA